MAKKPVDEKPVEASVRHPRVGDSLVLTGWNLGEQGLHAVCASAVGERVSMAYLSRVGSWLTAHLVPYDETGETPGSWRWPS
jgi:hypothetical protein